MKMKRFQRLLAFVLVLCMVVPLLPEFILPAVAEGTTEDPVIVIAGSDLQNDTLDSTTNLYSHELGAQTVTSILAQMQADGYTTADGFLFAGDYYYGSSDTESANGKAALQEAVQTAYPSLSADRMVWVQGNHESDSLATNGTLSTSGAHDADAYGVYVINEKDYMWYNSSESTVQSTAAALGTYLDEKVASNYNKPIFVISHLPLHYNMRTANDGDGRYANYIFDELNSAGAKGLNIIFLFGHNHSNGWDDYLGGAAIYLAKGDSINIAQASKTNFAVETLNFTYMNAGYVGYYRGVNTGSERDLTMTVFEITSAGVTIARYSADGKHDLKSAGVTNSYKNETAYAPDTRVYESTQSVTQYTVIQDDPTGVVVAGMGLKTLTVAKGNSAVPTGYSAYQTYDIRVGGHTFGDTVNVSIPVDSTFGASKPVLVIDHERNKTMVCQIEEGFVHFTTDHFSMYTVAQADVEAVTASGTLEKYLKRASSVSELKEGVPYVISDYNDNWYHYMLTDVVGEYVSSSSGTFAGLLLEGEPSANTEHVWYLVKDGDSFYPIYQSSDSGNYLLITSTGVTLGAFEASTAAYVVDNPYPGTYGTDDLGIKSTAGALNRRGGQPENNVATYYGSYSGSYWHFDEIVSDVPVSLAVTPTQKVVTTTGTVEMVPTVTVDGTSTSDYSITWTSDDTSIATVDANGIVTPVKPGQVNITATLTAVGGVSTTAPISVEILLTVVSVEEDSTSVTATTVLDKQMIKATTLQVGGPYAIVSRDSGWALTGNTGVNSGKCTGLELISEIDLDAEDLPVWYYDGTYLLYGTSTGSSNYLVYENNQVTLGTKSSTYPFTYIERYDSTSTSYVIGASETQLLNQYGGAPYNAAGVYSSRAHSRWYFYWVKPTVSLTVSPREDTIHPDQTTSLTPNVTINDIEMSTYSISWTSSDTSVATVDANGLVTPAGNKGGNVTITATLTAVDGTTLSAPLAVEIPIQVVSVVEDTNGTTASMILSETLTQVTTLEQGVPYVITSYTDGMVVTGTSESNYLKLEDRGAAGTNHVWYYDGTHLIYGSDTGSDNYMIYSGGNVTTGVNGTTAFDQVYLNDDNATFSIGNTATSQYLNQYGGKGSIKAYVWYQDGDNTDGSYTGGSKWYFNTIGAKRTASLNVTPSSGSILVGKRLDLTAAVALDGVSQSNYTLTWTSSDESIATVSNGKVYGWESGEVTITATLTKIGSETLETPLYVNIPVSVHGIKSVSISGKEASVAQRVSVNAKVGQTLTVTYDDGSTEEIPVTVGMLTDADGNKVNTSVAGTYSPLTVTYEGFEVCTDFALTVTKVVLNDYPEYPEEGSIAVNKTGSGINFTSTGMAQIELSASGVPSKKGADVIIMLDTSSSMNNPISEGSTVTRLQVLTESLNDLLTRLQADGADGNPMDIKVAVADFNGYYFDENSHYYIDGNDTTVNNHIRTTSEGDDVYTGTQDLTAGAFVDVHDMGQNPFFCNGYTGATSSQYGLYYSSGTNYDYAFDAIYQMGEAIHDYNAEQGLDRDLFVVFMSDGAPFQYNYLSSQSGPVTIYPGAEYWNNWLMGTFTDEMYGANANKTYYNENGLHWMAEAIKGERDENYPVIRKNDARDTDNNNWIEVAGLGATMYSIGFCLKDDGMIKLESMDKVIQNVASDSKYYFRANSASELNDAFDMITNEIFYAATNAYFIDTMGQHFDLITSNKIAWTQDGAVESMTFDPAPSIKVMHYELYVQSEVGETLTMTAADGSTVTVTVTVDMVGTRKPVASKVIETVTFSDDGKTITSDVIGSGTNILQNGVICASNFWYNTTEDAVTITLADGTTYSLPAETFYWKLGTISTTELTLSYYVYLTGSMEGLRDAGVYDTNSHAELFYTNYLGNPCSKEVPTPKLPWDKASVGYGFYLVDENGNPIVNQASGETGSFQNAVRITQPIYSEFLWNDGVQSLVASTLMSGVLPDGYELFDNGAKYEVQLDSDGDGYYIIYTGSNGKQTTYVVGVTTNAVTGGSISGEKTETTGYATSGTVVWFGVVANVGCVPDTVVIDFGIPVDVHPLVNDVMMTTGNTTLVGIGTNTTAPDSPSQTLASGFVGINTSLSVPFGNALINNDGEDDAYDAAVRYTLGTMDMNAESTFSYAVNYKGSVGTNGYYYSTITVIPATTIYYEDNFLDYKTYEYITDSDYSKKSPNYRGTKATDLTETNNQWASVGDRIDAVQAEDRPGSFSLSSIDANNIYGYDKAYYNLETHSLGSAMKFTTKNVANTGTRSYTNANGVVLTDVDMTGTYTKTYGTAEFNFSGTGFDVISVTSNTTGFIVVQVFKEDGTLAKSTMVDTYYGYKYVDGKWVVDTQDQNGLYQVPVIKISGLEYGKYRALITISYNEAFDHNANDGTQYDFYLDAIRIYDPANDGKDNSVIEGAYISDKEGWPEYFELRNMVISKETFDSLESDSIPGVIFIDNIADDRTDVSDYAPNVSDYSNYGPNNELYLAPGQAVTFSLNVDKDFNDDGVEDLAAIHLALKTVGSGTAQAKIHNVVNTSVPYSTLNTATDLYHDITVLNGKNVLISNSSDSAAIVSITNIKVTYNIEHEDTESPIPSEPVTVAMFMVDREVYEQAVYALTYVAPEIPVEPEQPEEPEQSEEPEQPEQSEQPEDSEETPGTGDEFAFALLAMLMLASVMGVAVLVLYRRKCV